MQVTHTPEFWSRYLFEQTHALGNPFFRSEDAPQPRVEDCTLAFRVGDNIGLDLSLSANLGYISLAVVHPSLSTPHEIAWDDEVHWHPHLMRWTELDTFCKACERSGNGETQGALLLLYRFTPICNDNDYALASHLLDRAWATVVGVKQAVAESRLARMDHRDSGFEWVSKPSGWFIQQSQEASKDAKAQLYSLRHPDNPEFPSAAFASVMDLARTIVARKP
jgi:hypothetical protein